jgi:hypothetical protein
MSTDRKASMAKRARELQQKDRVKEREARRAERRVRAEERAASGQVGPQIGEPVPVEDEDEAEGADVQADDAQLDAGAPPSSTPRTEAARTR